MHPSVCGEHTLEFAMKLRHKQVRTDNTTEGHVRKVANSLAVAQSTKQHQNGVFVWGCNCKKFEQNPVRVDADDDDVAAQEVQGLLPAMSDEMEEAGVDGCGFGSGRTTRNAGHPSGGDDFRRGWAGSQKVRLKCEDFACAQVPDTVLKGFMSAAMPACSAVRERGPVPVCSP